RRHTRFSRDWSSDVCSSDLRVPGVDLVQRVLELGGGDVTVYLLGGRPGVAEAAARAVERRYGTRVLGAHHGYFASDEETAAVVRSEERRVGEGGRGGGSRGR